ncbi:hypothetical protein Y032_0283g1320 [Ancylostoma ceylanicum]|uniref:Uncharacterized protein n=1 Tax=Ancylostoma ceylanicum TaxID=53326 RepID=A0A016S6F2_9BILA|nr:hypothetical protein Y032_0283g1320 [Ancylostoma ceylanicum]
MNKSTIRLMWPWKSVFCLGPVFLITFAPRLDHLRDAGTITKLLNTVERNTRSIIDCLCVKHDALRRELRNTYSHFKNITANPHPKYATLTVNNLKDDWNIPAIPPLNSVCLKELMDKWKQSTRAGEDEHTTCVVDFLRY